LGEGSDYEGESDRMIWRYGSGNDSVSFCLLMPLLATVINFIMHYLYELLCLDKIASLFQ